MKKKYIKFRIIVLFLILTSLSLIGCKKFIEVDPPITSITDASVFLNDKTAAAVLTNIYTRMSSENISGITVGKLSGVTLLLGLSSDEITLFDLTNQNLLNYYKNELQSNQDDHFWNGIYPVIFNCNAAIEGLNASTSLTPAVKQQLLGEAKFMRAFCYFYLVNLYGDVPLALTTDYKVNALLHRSDKGLVYNQIETDLIDAENLLNSSYQDGSANKTTTQRVRPCKAAATALLARVYLYTQNWAKAEVKATSIISNTVQYDTVGINNVFLMNSKETIWALQPVGSAAGFSANTGEGRTFVLPGTGPGQLNVVYLNSKVPGSFEPGDKRKASWVAKVNSNGTDYYYAYKYKIGRTNSPTAEYSIVLRLAEQYLIRAEARAQLGNVTESQSDLNVIRKRAGLAITNVSAGPALIDAIVHERQTELFTEWGHRWFDLKRIGRLDNIMTVAAPLKDHATWTSYKGLFPIPLADILKDPNLQGHQNPGYGQ